MLIQKSKIKNQKSKIKNQTLTYHVSNREKPKKKSSGYSLINVSIVQNINNIQKNVMMCLYVDCSYNYKPCVLALTGPP